MLRLKYNKMEGEDYPAISLYEPFLYMVVI